MDLCNKVINFIFSLKRLIRFIKYDPMSITNSPPCNLNDKPLSIVTWNLQGLFLYMNNQKVKNIIHELLCLDQDILCLQEVFEDSLKSEIIHKLQKNYPYHLLGNCHKKYIIGEDSGLLVLSKYPIEFVKEIVLGESVMPDKLSNKSILYFKVGNLNLVTTHLQSSNMVPGGDIARDQIKLIVKESPFESYIITGDLNSDDACIHIDQPKNNTCVTWENEVLDYIIPINYPTMRLTTKVYDIDITNISDHKALIGKIAN